MQSPCEYLKDGVESETVQSPRFSPEMKVEVVKSTEKPKNTYEEELLLSTSESDMSESEENLCSRQNRQKRNCTLKKHMIVHDDAYPFECPICDQGFKTEQSFKFHMSSHEGGKELFHCADCDFKSRKAADVKRHQIGWHANNMYGFKCHFCTKIFKDKTMFLEHMENHSVVVCNVCDEVCEDNNHLTQHKCKHKDDQNDVNYSLQYSGQCEENEIDIEYHTIEEREFKLEKMDFQEYSDESFDELDSDLNSFKGQMYFNCPQCKWRFRTSKLLEKHLKRHSQSFKCDYCDAVFKYRACFLKHKYKHKNKY
ncbi:zinc finger protein 639-like isoform X2 [Anoplolepis gracilipes]